MNTVDEVELTPEQKNRELIILMNISRLLETEMSRYEAQAIQLIELKKLETEVLGFKLSYAVKEKSYLCKLQNKDKTRNNYEIEFPIPDSKLDKIDTLKIGRAHVWTPVTL